MKVERIIEMIDEHLTEPHSINREWVEALTICRQALIDKESITEIFDKAVKYKEECKKKDTEIDILIRKNETLKDEVERLQFLLTEAYKTAEEVSENWELRKSEARKEFAERVYRFLCNWRNWNALKTKWLFNGECEWLKEKIDNLVKEMDKQ